VWVDYTTKEMHHGITHKGRHVILQGMRNQLQECAEISPKKLQGLIKTGGLPCCIQFHSEPPVTVLLDEQQYLCALQEGKRWNPRANPTIDPRGSITCLQHLQRSLLLDLQITKST
jgi:hypothetical protein